MNLKKIHKLIQKKFKLDYWIVILIPLAGFFGILVQVGALSKYNAVSLFSWGQVFSDSAIILPLFLSGLLGYISYISYSTSKPNIWRKLFSLIYLLAFGFATQAFISIYTTNNYYLLGVFLFFFSGYLLSMINNSLMPKEGDKILWDYIYPGLTYILFFCFFALVFLIGTLLTGYVNQSIQIIIDGNTYNINYMNDKYIIFGDGEVIKTSEEYKIKLIK